MPLKLIVGSKDRIITSNGIIITVKTIGKRVTLEFDAPSDIKIHTIFNDPEKQFKNLRKTDKDGQSLSPEQQRQMALNNLRGKS